MAYKTIQSPVQFQQKILRSVFHCFLFPIESADEARTLISTHNKEYANATHNCFAYICGFGQETQYYSDAGEPHGTAGKPMLNALLHSELTCVMAIVTRYYGGVKLGVKGLIAAYGNTVEQAVNNADKISAQMFCQFVVSAEYSLVDTLTNMANSFQGSILESQWGERAELTLRIPDCRKESMVEILDGFQLQSRLDYRQVR